VAVLDALRTMLSLEPKNIPSLQRRINLASHGVRRAIWISTAELREPGQTRSSHDSIRS
jgi:hypothetical protein